MRKTRRHKYLQISVFFLIYSIIHVVSISNNDVDKNQDAVKVGNDKTVKDGGDAGIDHLKPANKSGEHLADKNTTEQHEHASEKIAGHLLGTLGDHGSANKSIKHGGNDSSTHPESEGDKTKHPHGSELSDKEKARQHVGEMTLHHLSGSIGNHSLNRTEHLQEGFLHHLGGAIGGHPPNVTGQGNATKNASGSAKAGAKNEAKHVLAGGAAVGSGKGNGTKGNGTEESKMKVECTPPAIKQFPHPIMSPSTRRHGGLIIHVLVAVYMFLGLAIVCDEYFVASLDRICEELKMSPDVAGATFMAAGSSAPELATVIIGVFLAQDDIGISGVIGSAVFNIMFVISCCGLCSSVVIYLNWWPLIRDCFFYAVSVLVLLLTIYDESITWVESLVLLFTYCIYCVALHFNTLLESIAYSLPVPFRHTAPTEQSGLVSYKTLDDDGKKPNYGMDWSPEKQQENADPDLQNFGAEWSPERQQPGFVNQLSGPALNQATIEASPQQPVPSSRPIQQDYYKPKEYDPSTQVNPLVKPEGAGIYRLTVWAIVYPIHWLCRMTMPDCRSDKYKNWYPFTFFVSMVWISFYSYFMVWMITLIGYTLYIPDTVMGLTFVAAGVSVPDALSSVAVIKEGYGDMAVSNAVGSNVFDILVCLGLPWFIKTAIVSPGSTVIVKSKGLTYSTLSLLSTVVLLVVATHMNGWKLDRRYGIILMIWYLIFITIASIYEFNVFKPCDESDW